LALRCCDLKPLGLYTGARIEELCGLRVRNVELHRDKAFLEVEKGQADAAERTIAVVNPVARAVFKRRLAGKTKEARILVES